LAKQDSQWWALEQVSQGDSQGKHFLIGESEWKKPEVQVATHSFSVFKYNGL
jgi:hypothetical protein